MSNLIYTKMLSVMREIGAVGKDQKNTAQGFKFRGIDQFINALYPALTKHGVFMAPKVEAYTQELKSVERSNGRSGIDKHVHLMTSYTFYAEDGTSVTIGPIASEGLDSGDKATNKALSAALKYALIQTFSIPTEDMEDGDTVSPEIASVSSISAPPATQIVEKPTSAPADAQETPLSTPAASAPSSKRASSFRRPGQKAANAAAPVAADDGGIF